MRPPARPALAVLFLALCFPGPTRAQFTQPTADELKMTADPKAPGANAVYLYREEITDDGNHYLSYYNRIKILAEKGKDMATVTIPYVHGVDTVTDVSGRTIHPDGVIVPLEAKPSDLMDIKTKGYQVNTVVFTLPDVQVGSIVEYRLKIRTPEYRVSEPEWEVQVAHFAHKEHFEFRVHTGYGVVNSAGDSLNRIMYTFHLPKGGNIAHDNRKDIYALDVADEPPLPEEDWMPPLNTLRDQVQFYFTNAMDTVGFWKDAAKKWASSVDDFTKPTGELKRAAAELISPTDSDLDKARKLYAAVQKLDNTRFSRVKSEAERKKEKLHEIRNAEDVWKQQSGTDDQITLLYVALCRSAGVKAYAARVVDRSRALIDVRYLSIRQLDDELAILSIDGKETVVDPGQKMCPFGAMSWKHNLAGGFRTSDSGADPLNTAAANYKAAKVQRIADLTIDATGQVTGSVRIVMLGPEALHWRQMTLRYDPDEVKKRFNESLKDALPDGVHAEFDHFLGLDDYESNLIGIVKVTGSLGSATGKRFFLPGLFFESHAKHPFVAQEKRETPIDVQYPRTEEDDATYHLPAGYTVESAPAASSESWPQHALLAIKTSQDAGLVETTRTLIFNYTLLDAKDYPALHDFYQKVAAADQQQLVLIKAAAPKGN